MEVQEKQILGNTGDGLVYNAQTSDEDLRACQEPWDLMDRLYEEWRDQGMRDETVRTASGVGQ